MNYNKKLFKKAEGREILEVLINGDKVFLDENLQAWWFLEGDKIKYRRPTGLKDHAQIKINELLGGEFLIEVPYDVTKDMVSNPGKWVAEYKGQNGQMWVVGFDYSECMAVRVIKENMNCSVRYGAGDSSGWVGAVPVGDLKLCYPL